MFEQHAAHTPARDKAQAATHRRPDAGRPRPAAAVQRAIGNSALAADAASAAAVRALDGPGTPVEASRRAAVERAVGQDLGDVLVHTGPAVRVAARAAGAAGFTIGRDIGIATGPGQDIPQPLLVHELVHAAQQGVGGNASPADAERQAGAAGHGIGALAALAGTSAPYVAWAAEDWLNGTPDISHYGLTDLLDELRAVNEWLGRQIAGTQETDRMQEAKAALEAEVARRQRAISGPERRRPTGGGQGRRRQAPAAPPEPVPQTEMPHVLRDRSSAQLTDPAEIRAEVDRIAAWLARPDVSAADRATLRQELALFAPELGADLNRASAQRQQARLTRALAPTGTPDRAGILANIRIVESIRPYDATPGMAYVIHQGELLVFPQETADRVRTEVIASLQEAARRARSMNDGTSFRMDAHMRLNYEEHPYVGFAVSVVSGEEPVEVQARMLGPLSNSNIALQRYIGAARRGSLVDMADAVLTAVENADTAQRIVLDGIDRAMSAAGSIVHGLEITRDLAFAIALTVGAILAAPVVAAGVAGLGVTGLAATALTAAGTGTVVGGEGFLLGFTGGAGGELAAGHSARDALRVGTSEGVRVGKQGVAIGVGGGASLGLAGNLGVGAQGLSRFGALGRSALAQGGGNALGGVTGGLLSPPEGVGRGAAAFRGGLTGFGLGAFGGVAGTYAQGLSSPLAQRAVGIGLPSLAGGGLTYLQTGDLEQALEVGGTALAVGSLTLNRPTGLGGAAQQRAFQAGQSVRQGFGAAGRLVSPYLAATVLGLSEPLPALRLGSSRAPITLTDPRTTTTVAPPSTPAPAPAPAPTPAPAPVPAPAPAVRISQGAFPINPARQVVDPFSGAVLGQRSASALTARSVITGPRADEAEVATWRLALQRGEIGIQAPLGANVAGPDFITATVDPAGQVTIFVNDTKLSTTGRFPTPATAIPTTWGAEVAAAIAPGRLNLGDPVLEAAIRQAYAAGRVQIRQLNADYTPTGGGRVTGF